MELNYLYFPKIKPIFFSLGFISLHWYGLMYVISFLFVRWISTKKISNISNIWKKKEIEELIYSCFFSAIIGGRIGYELFYNLSFALKNPFSILEIWKGGMSFHGGLLGVIFSIFWKSRKRKNSFLQTTDFISPIIPFCLGIGRLGNFINGELWGRVTKIPWAMFFPNAKHSDFLFIKNNPNYIELFKKYGALPRHPSQIYEFFLEGFLLFLLLNSFPVKRKRVGAVSAAFLFLYGIFRFLVEFFRDPDIQIGLFKNTISMGQILSIPMILSGLILFLKVYFSLNILSSK